MPTVTPTPIPIPLPGEVAQLRREFGEDRLVEAAEYSIRQFAGNVDPQTARLLLAHWQHVDKLSDRKRAAVIAFFVVPADQAPTAGRDLVAAAAEFVRAGRPTDDRHAAEILVRWGRASELTYDQAAAVVARFRRQDPR